MTTFPDRLRRFARAARQLPNNAAAVREQLDALSTRTPVDDTTGHSASAESDAAIRGARATTAERLDELATNIRTPDVAEPRPDGLSLLTAWHRPAPETIDALAVEPAHTVLLTPGTTASEPLVEHDRTVLRTPEPLDWRRALLPLLRAAPTRYAVLLHPAVRPRHGAAELWSSFSTGVALVGGMITATGATGETMRAASECLALVEVDAVVACLQSQFREQACNADLSAMLARAGEVVVRSPRLVGSHSTPEQEL